MVIVVPADQADAVSDTLSSHGEQVSRLGSIVPRVGDAAQTVVI